jgi:simple sugar transport system permease protein
VRRPTRPSSYSCSNSPSGGEFTQWFSSPYTINGTNGRAGIRQRLKRGISPGYGFTAIIPAWLSNLNPALGLPASILIGGLFVGGDIIQISLKLPFGVVNVFNGIILILLASSEFLVKYRVVIEA